ASARSIRAGASTRTRPDTDVWQVHDRVRQERLDQRADSEGERQRRPAEDPAKQPSHGHYGHLDARPHQPYRPAGHAREARHEAVPRSPAELAADVESRGVPVEDDAASGERDLPYQAVG